MSWRLASFVILGVVLAGGLAWYERSRPSSRIVALVAALAALAVAGRLAFAPIPNVQATTDVVLFTGFALGAAPGFAVGALAALVSNLWLGQGPWTPWETAGWGLVGLGAAALGSMTSRRLGRFGLAAAGALAGILYGALLDFSVMVTAGGDFSLDRYAAISARGLPFNVAHAVGNAALALAAGPAMIRMIVRYRKRLEFSWRPQLAASSFALIATLVLALAATHPPASNASGSASGWLAAARNSDGGYGSSPGQGSSAEMTGWASLGLEAAGINPLDLGHGSKTPIGYLRSHVGSITSTGDLERTILAVDAAGVNPRDFAGHDLVAKLQGRQASSGSFQNQVNLTAFGILALRSAGVSGVSLRTASNWLEHAQGNDGGWGFQNGIAGDPDSTGAAMQGIAAVEPSSNALTSGVRFLRRDQNSDGGWPLGGSGPSNTQSTAWAIQGLVAAGVSPGAVQENKHSGGDYLRARQDSDGHYRYSSSSDQTPVWVTGQAIVAAQGKTFPLASVPRTVQPTAGGGGSHHGVSAANGSGGSGSSGGTTAGEGRGNQTTSTTGGGATSPGYGGLPSGGGSLPGGFGGAHGPGGSKGTAGHGTPSPQDTSAGPPDPSLAADSRRLFADTDVPQASVSGDPSSGTSGAKNTTRDILIGVGALALLGGGWLAYRRFA